MKWVGICVDPDLSDADVKAHARDFDLKFPVVRDRHGALARKIGATMTPEAFVVDTKGRVRYHGRIDDQFAKRGVRNANPSGNELKDAIAALLKGEEVKAPHVAAVGCPIPEFKAAADAPTYSKEVARILEQNCRECHRKGQVGPFALDTYDQARKRAEDIAAVAEDRSMPPWKAAPNVGPKFKHDRSLSSQDIATLSSWAEAGAPEGDPADLPPPRKFPDDWTLEGGPDLVLDIGTDFQVRPRAGTSTAASWCPPACPTTCTSRGSSTSRATAAWSITCWRTLIRRGSPQERRRRTGPGLYLLFRPRRRDSRRPGRLGAGQPAHPARGWHRTVPSQECRCGHPGSLSSRRQVRGRSDTDRAAVFPQTHPPDRSTGMPRQTWR